MSKTIVRKVKIPANYTPVDWEIRNNFMFFRFVKSPSIKLKVRGMI